MEKKEKKVEILTSTCPHCGYVYKVKKTFKKGGIVDYHHPIVGGLSTKRWNREDFPSYDSGIRVLDIPIYGDVLLKKEVICGDEPFAPSKYSEEGLMCNHVHLGVACPKCFYFFSRAEVETEEEE